ncbi:MAG: sugar phosphate nucleotidyltransferase, partial [Acidobacteriota bacterium]
MSSGLYCVILAGGRGTRIWPLARRDTPKPFLRLFENRSFLRVTFERILPLCPPERILVVAGREHRELICRELPEVPENNLLL